MDMVDLAPVCVPMMSMLIGEIIENNDMAPQVN